MTWTAGYYGALDGVGNAMGWVNMLGGAQPKSWGVVIPMLPTAAQLTALATPYLCNNVFADSNFRVGFGVASRDPGGGLRNYVVAYVFNGTVFVGDWFDIGPTSGGLPPSGLIAHMRMDYVGPGTGILYAGANGVETAGTNTTNGMGAGAVSPWLGRGGTGFGDNFFVGITGGVYVKGTAVLASTRIAGYKSYFAIP